MLVTLPSLEGKQGWVDRELARLRRVHANVLVDRDKVMQHAARTLQNNEM